MESHSQPKNLSAAAGWWATEAPACVLRVTGEDAFTFLQGHFSQDLRPPQAPVAAYGLWLNGKGRVLADSWVLRGQPATAWLVSSFSPAEVVQARLEQFLIADDVVLDNHTAHAHLLILGGAEGAAWLQSQVGPLPLAGQCGHDPVLGLWWRGRRGAEETWEWLRPGPEPVPILQPGPFPVPTGAPPAASLPLPSLQPLPPAHWVQLDAAGLRLLRIAAGIPAIPLEFGPGELPQEGGLETHAVSFNKGCYLGQEVMARLHAMGQVRRKLLRVKGSLPPSATLLSDAPALPPPTLPAPALPAATWPALPAALWQGEVQVGELRAWAPDRAAGCGLALLSLLKYQPERGLALSPAGAELLYATDPV